MKDSLQKFIQENREALDSQTPPENSWKQIESALPKISQQIFWNSVSFWRVAAMVLLGLSVYLLISKNY